jgi:hypothetical protein
MSSYGGTDTQLAGQKTDPTLQLAPAPDEGPDFGALKNAFEICVSNLSAFRDQCEENFRTRYALWDNQTSDGRKHAREGSKIDPTPWDGASDLRVFKVDEAINAKVAMLCTAFKKANLVATPIEGNDLERANIVTSFMRWLVYTQIPELARERKLLANYLQEKGIAATGVFWETKQEKTLTTITLQDLAQAFPTINVAELIYATEAEEDLMAIFEEQYGCSHKKAKRMVMELREKQTTTVPTVGRTQSRPVVRAFNLDRDLFIPDSSTDIETAEAIYRVQYFPPEQLRSFVNTDGWDAEWVEDAIESLRGKYVTPANYEDNQPLNRSFIYIEQRMTDLIGVVYAYQRLSDEDGVPGIYCTIFNPLLPPSQARNGHKGYAKFGLLGYAHGQYPFVIFKREQLSRKLHDTRGMPEPGLPSQQQIKVHKDSRIDAASLAILPPMGYPVGRPPGRWGAGARVPERRPGEYHFMDRPQADPLTEKSEALLSADFDRYFGFVSAETDPTYATLKAKDEVDDWLDGWRRALWQTWKLWQQFGSDEVYFRVIGVRTANPMLMRKGDPTEDYDFNLNFDVDSLNVEQWTKKMETMVKIATSADPEGITNWARLTQLLYQGVDVTLAEQIVDPKEVASARFIEEEKGALSELFAGFDNDIKMGSPAQLGMQVIQQYAQVPDVARRLQADDAFRKRLEKRFKQYEFQATQSQNAQIGRMGAGPVQYNSAPQQQSQQAPQ